MQFLDGSFNAAATAITDLVRDHGGTLPAPAYGALAKFWPSPVDRIVHACEALYASADALPEAGLVLCAQLARIAQENGFHALGQTDRAPRIIRAVRRRLGELTEAEAPAAEDPEPDPAYLAA